MARLRSARSSERYELLRIAWDAAHLDDVRTRLRQSAEPIRTQATLDALEALSPADAAWVVELAEGRTYAQGSVDELLERRAAS